MHVDWPSRRRGAIGVILLAHAGAVAALIWINSFVVPGRGRYFVLADDPMISMRYGRNLARGLGLVWNAGERIEGFSDPLWTLYMALLHTLPIPENLLGLAVQATNLCVDLLLLLAAGRLVRAAAPASFVPAAALVAMAGLALSAPILLWSVAGAEGSLAALLITLGLTTWRPAGPARTTPFALLALASLVRPEATAALLAAAVVSAAQGQGRRRGLARAVAPAALLAAAIYPLRLGYYGELLPNTYYLRTAHVSGQELVGLAYLGAFLVRGPGLLAAIPLARALLGRDRRWLDRLTVVGAYALAVAYGGGDGAEEYRLLVPVIPAIVALAVASAWPILSRWPASVAVAVGLVGLVLPSLPAYAAIAGELSAPAEPRLPAPELPALNGATAAFNTELALYLREHAVGTPRIAVFEAGTVPYFVDWPAVDLLGKADRRIAREAPRSGTIPGHNKWDYAYSLGAYRPDVLVTNLTGDPAADAAPARRDLLAEPAFRTEYEGNVLDWAGAAIWAGVLVRRGSPELGAVALRPQAAGSRRESAPESRALAETTPTGR